MKRKKLFSTAVAGMLVAAQMVMPVAAAAPTPNGEFDVDLTTKTGVLRVEVPTSMAIAVDQFMITTPGTQIASSEFPMTNKSEMAVKVEVTSTATLGSGISLVPTAAAAKSSQGNEAWLGVAAMTGDGAYDIADTTDKTETKGDLTDANTNVTTFVTENSTSTAKQTFYLEKGTGAASYALAVPAATTNKVADKDRTYTKFYELTAIDMTGATDDTAKEAKVKAQVDASDVYVVITADAGKDGTAVTKIAKGDTFTYANTNTYYTADDEGVELSAVNAASNTKIYVYGTMATAGGKAGFTYIGKLSGARETWTKADISKIHVAYTITGVTVDRYDEVKDACKYGLYTGSGSSSTTETACKLQTIVSGTGTDITPATTADKGIYIKVGSNFLTTASDKLTSVKLNNTELTISTKGNSSGNANAVYFKMPTGTTLRSGDKFTIVLDGTTYVFTVA